MTTASWQCSPCLRFRLQKAGLRKYNFYYLKVFSNEMAPDHIFFWIMTYSRRRGVATLGYCTVYFFAHFCPFFFWGCFTRQFGLFKKSDIPFNFFLNLNLNYWTKVGQKIHCILGYRALGIIGSCLVSCISWCDSKVYNAKAKAIWQFVHYFTKNPISKMAKRKCASVSKYERF
jgi:hypothetical protein